MLIYNNKKDFIGIDEHDLKRLGFSSLSELQYKAADFADLFTKEPGFVHNFTHVNWIDFVECADSKEGSKALISVNSKNFKCNLTVTIAFLTEEPSSKAYLVHLNNLVELTDDQASYVSVELLEQSTPEPRVSPAKKMSVDSMESTKSKNVNNIPSQDNETKIVPDLNISKKDEATPEIKLEKEITDSEVFDNGYIYDPLVASSELGLPVELIEEFIEDFIAQAKEFKDELYVSSHNGDKENLKALSHKLKGVAANLRVEDALESLTIINTSDSSGEIQKHLDIFYKIISKLSSENIEIAETVIDKAEEDMIELDEKENFDSDIKLEDNDVPEKIDMPELADDEFLNQTVQEEVEEKLASIEMLDDDIFNSKDMDTITQNQQSETSEIDETESFELEFKDVNISPEHKEDTVPDLNKIEDFELEFKDSLPDIVTEPTPGVYNKELVASEIGLDKESFNELLEDYLFEANNICTTISKAIGEDDSKVWIQQALKLRGMSENMRVESFKEELDSLIKTDQGNIAKEAHEKILESIKQISNMED